jgi:hypothetical protein
MKKNQIVRVKTHLKHDDTYQEAQRLWDRAVETNGTSDHEYWWNLYRDHLTMYFPAHRYARKGDE